MNTRPTLFLLPMLLAAPAIALAADHSGQSAAHSGASVAASGKATSAASAIPLSVGGAALSVGGAVSMGAADASARAAVTPIGKPLEITDETITVTPPNEALKPKGKPADTGKTKTDQPI